MSITMNQRAELLSYNDGKPFIITERGNFHDTESFSLLIFVRTISSAEPNYTNSVSLSLTFTSAFPFDAPMVQLSQGKLYHPNFTDDGRWLYSKLKNSESLSEYLMRLARILQYKEIETEKLANRNAMAWYNKYKSSNIFPTDASNYLFKPRISIHQINDIQHQRAESIQIGAIHYE